jgi:hypothetical protein
MTRAVTATTNETTWATTSMSAVTDTGGADESRRQEEAPPIRDGALPGYSPKTSAG